MPNFQMASWYVEVAQNQQDFSAAMVEKFSADAKALAEAREQAAQSEEHQKLMQLCAEKVKALQASTEAAKAAEALDVDTMLAIHRSSAGHIGFMRKSDGGGLENLGSVSVTELRSLLPQISEWLLQDSYFTVNTYYKAAPWLNKKTGLPGVRRKEKFLQTLNVCYLDVDVGRPESDMPGAGLPWREAQHRAEYLADKDVIPHPSIIARSGRGVYLLWLLRDEKASDDLQHAWPEKIEWYKQINRSLGERLRSKQLPADRVSDAARVLRVPGSVNTSVQEPVAYVLQLKPNGKPYVYSLAELSSFLQLPFTSSGSYLPTQLRELAKPLQYRRTKATGSVPARSAGAQKLNAMRAQDVATIEAYRGGWLKKGLQYADGRVSPGRRLMLGVFANFLRGAKASEEDALKAVDGMAANCKPFPFHYHGPGAQKKPSTRDLVEQEYASPKRKWYANKTLCSLFGITAELAEELELRTIVPDVVRERRHKERPHQEDLIAARRSFAQTCLDKKPGLSCRQLAKLYAAEGFSDASFITANRDMNALGYITSKRRTGAHAKYLAERKAQAPAGA